MRALPQRIFLGAAVLGVVAALAAGVALASMLEGAPRTERPGAVTPADVAGLGALLRGLDLRVVEPAPQRVVVATQRQLDLLLDQAVRRLPNTVARIELRPGTARLRASVEVPRNPFGRWLNVDARFEQTAALPRLAVLHIGRLPLPGWLARPVAQALLAHADPHGRHRLAADIVCSIGFDAGRAQALYVWRADTRQRVGAALLPPADRARLAAYARRLAELAAAGPGGEVSLAAVLPPLFELARQRSGAAGGDAARENRAAILMLALHAAGGAQRAAGPAAFGAPIAAPPHLTLAGRDDFPQHLLISAALAIEGGGAFADAVGLYKEIADTHGGSGFSFNDIAADRAGTRLGLLAVQRPAELQARLAAGVAEADFMPDVSDLPEFLAGDEFRRRYGSAGSPAYERMLANIDARVGALRLLARAQR